MNMGICRRFWSDGSMAAQNGAESFEVLMGTMEVKTMAAV
jgi:hypothetical protein